MLRGKHQREESKMASGAQPDPWYLSLLGIAESFRTSNPPNIRLCLHCLQTILNLKPPPRIEARTRLQIGSILFSHTKNIDLARSNLESSVSSRDVYLNWSLILLKRLIVSDNFDNSLYHQMELINNNFFYFQWSLSSTVSFSKYNDSDIHM